MFRTLLCGARILSFELSVHGCRRILSFQLSSAHEWSTIFEGKSLSFDPRFVSTWIVSFQLSHLLSFVHGWPYFKEQSCRSLSFDLQFVPRSTGNIIFENACFSPPQAKKNRDFKLFICFRKAFSEHFPLSFGRLRRRNPHIFLKT